MSEIELQQQPDDARARTETHDPSEIARAEDPTCVGIYGAAGALDGTDITDEVSLFVWLNRLAQHRTHFPITVLENELVYLDSFFRPRLPQNKQQRTTNQSEHSKLFQSTILLFQSCQPFMELVELVLAEIHVVPPVVLPA